MNPKEYFKERLLNSLYEKNENDDPIGRFRSASKGASDTNHPIGRFRSASKGVSRIKSEIEEIKKRMSPDGTRSSDPYTDEYDALARRLQELQKKLKSM